MSAPGEPVIQTCTACGVLIDVTDEEPFALMHCPGCGAAQRVRRSFDHFELQEVLGSGGMGSVYRALDTSLNRTVALKLLRKEYSADREFVAQFEKEAAITASINHPNVVKVYTAGQDHDLVYIVMELVDKGSLDDLMSLQGRVPEAQVLEVGVQIAKGLNAALQRGLIHRDVKPGNILFADAHTAKIVDFGLAVLQEHASTVAGEVWGTPYYVAPEKLDNQPEDFRSDMYSLGGTLFHALAGRPPFEAETASMVALKHIKSQAVSLQAFAPEVSSPTAYVINKTLEKDPNNRYQSYEELIEHLDYARTQLVARGPAHKPRVVIEDAASQRAMGWMTVGMIAAVVGGGVFLYVRRDAFTKSEPKVDVRVEAARQANASIEPKFKEARELLVAGKLDEAVKELDKLEETPNVPQPLLNWITLHQGLALLLSGHEAEARPVFAKIEERGVYSHDPAEEKMANFFTDTAHQLAGQFPVQSSVARNYEKSNHQAIALLLFALKDWQMGKFDEAGPLFRQFHSSSPEAPHQWIADYREFATQYIDAYTEYHDISGKLRAANTVAERKEAVMAAKAAREKIQVKGKLASLLDETIAIVEKKIADLEKEETEKMAARDAADTKALDEMRTGVEALLQQLKFSEAHALAAAAAVNGEKGRGEQASLVKRTDWLAKFKTTLVTDINAAGYPGPIKRRNGTAVAGAAARANDLGVEVKTPYGGTPALWTDLSLDTLLGMGRYFLKQGKDEGAVADRQWACGVFALFANKQAEGRELLNAAAVAKPGYKEELPQFLDGAAP